MTSRQKKLLSVLPPLAILLITGIYVSSVVNLASVVPSNQVSPTPTRPPKSKLNPSFTNTQLTEVYPQSSVDSPISLPTQSPTSSTKPSSQQPTPYKYPTNTPTKIPSPTSQATSQNTTTVPTPTPLNGWIMHTSERGIRINYPAASYYVSDTSDDGINAANFLPNSLALGGFNLPENSLPSTIYQALFSANVGSATDCTKYTTGQSQSTLTQTTNISSNTYYTVTLAATTYGVSTETRIFHVVKNTRCYELVQSVYYAQGSQIPSSVWSTLNTALSSVTYF